MLYWLLKEQMGKPIKFSEPRQWIIFNQVSVIFSGHMALWKFDNNVARKADIICRRNWQAKSFLSLQGPRLKCTKDKMLVCESEYLHRSSCYYFKSTVDIRILNETERQIMNWNRYVSVRYKAKITQNVIWYKAAFGLVKRSHKYFGVVKGKDIFLALCAN